MYLKNIILVIICCLLLSSCFEIRETVKMNSNGSGTYMFVLDMGQLKELYMAGRNLQQSMLPDSLKKKGYKAKASSPIDQIKPKFDALKDILESVKGITNYKTVYDSANFLIGAQYDFANVTALNKAINIIQKKKDEAVKQAEVDHFAISDKSFERFHTISPEDMDVYRGKDSISASMSAKVKYAVRYEFDKKIKDYDNMEYYMSGDGKTVIFSAYLQDLIKGKTTIANKIRF
jgi:hypothetical protein